MANFCGSFSFKGFHLMSGWYWLLFVMTPLLRTLHSSQTKLLKSSVSNVSVQPSELELLGTELATLTKVVNSLKLHRRSRSSSNSTSHRRSPSPAGQPRPLTENSDLCWYHQTFGDSARKCKPPCSKSGNNQASH